MHDFTAARIESARAFRINRPSEPQGSIRLYGSAASAAAIEQLQVFTSRRHQSPNVPHARH
jgi:hypothetical protein